MSETDSLPTPLRILILVPERDLASALEQSLLSMHGVGSARVIHSLPAPDDLGRLLQAHLPEVLFISSSDLAGVAAAVAVIRREAPGIAVVAVDRACDSERLLDLMRLGIQEFLPAPFDSQPTGECLARVRREIEGNPEMVRGTDHVYSFLPAKPGVGTTTLAVNAAHAFARLKGDRVFLGDFDLNCGFVRFQLKLTAEMSTLDATERVHQIDENVWPQMVTEFGSLHVMHSGTVNPLSRMELIHLRHLLHYLRRAYRIVVADLSGNMEKYSLEIMSDSKQIFLVTTPELPALHLAREKFQMLQNLDLGGKVRVLLNRFNAKRSPLSVHEVEEIVGRPVALAVENDYASVHQAVSAGVFVKSDTPISRQCQALAEMIYKEHAFTRQTPERRFVEYFSLVPTLYKVQKN